MFYGPAGYVGVFSLLVACGLGLPLPEDIALISGGYLAATPHGVGSVWLMMLTGLAGILVGDSIIFKAGRDYGDALLETRLGRHIPRDRVAKIREVFARHGPKFIMVARFMPGVRAVTYFVAGSSRVSYWVFLTYDGLAALISAPAWVWLGYWAGKNHALRRALHMAGQFQKTLAVVIALAALVGLLVWLVRKRRARAAAQAQGAAAALAQPASGANGAAAAAKVADPVAAAPKQASKRPPSGRATPVEPA
jgi:membrane protein DedA with SNARE-associated domain